MLVSSQGEPRWPRLYNDHDDGLGGSQVKVAEHVLTGHKVAIKILNRKKIQAMDMEETGNALQLLSWSCKRGRRAEWGSHCVPWH